MKTAIRKEVTTGERFDVFLDSEASINFDVLQIAKTNSKVKIYAIFARMKWKELSTANKRPPN